MQRGNVCHVDIDCRICYQAAVLVWKAAATEHGVGIILVPHDSLIRHHVASAGAAGLSAKGIYTLTKVIVLAVAHVHA